MTEVLLNELSNTDIDWMTTIGHQAEIAAGKVLVEPGKPVEALHIVIDGTLSVSVPQDDNISSRASAPVRVKSTTREIIKLLSGEVVGEMAFVGEHLPVITVKALEKSLVLSIPRSQLAAKLQRDVSFAAHFYHAIAILLSNRLRVIDSLSGNTELASNPEQVLKKVLFILGQLSDSDIDWMMRVGSKEKIAAGTVLIHQGRPVDALHMLLHGTMTVSICHANMTPLYRSFVEKKCESGTIKQEVARLSSGEMLGEVSFLDNQYASAFVTCLEDCQVLSLSRNQLVAKLEMDVGFAARFYRAIAAIIEDRLRSAIIRLTYGKHTYSTGNMLDAETEHEDEIDLDVLDNTALAGARFDWILRRFRGS